MTEIGSRKWHRKHRRRMARVRGKQWCLVYALVDPDTGDARYIGQTRDSRTRLAYHLKDAKENKARAVCRWIASLLEQGKEPKMLVLDDDGVWDVTEIIWIERFRARGANLLNRTLGGLDAMKRKGTVTRHPDAIDPQVMQA